MNHAFFDLVSTSASLEKQCFRSGNKKKNQVRPTLLFSVPTLFKKVYDGVQANFAEQTGAKKLLIDRALAVANERRLLLTEGQQPGALLSLQHKVCVGGAGLLSPLPRALLTTV
mmetsp:Transcript_2670/g.4462  ORF Transcript_2670/g.4462 Transcript_2670/m.4462 type:complete len:114 (-) Transcript_2670:1844-2185(-)